MWWTVTLFKLIRIPESGKFLLVETGILGFRILESGIQLKNPESRKRLESEVHWHGLQHFESGIHSWNPESKTVLDYFTRGEFTTK